MPAVTPARSALPARAESGAAPAWNKLRESVSRIVPKEESDPNALRSLAAVVDVALEADARKVRRRRPRAAMAIELSVHVNGVRTVITTAPGGTRGHISAAVQPQ